MSFASWFDRTFIVEEGWRYADPPQAEPTSPPSKPRLAAVRSAPSRDDFAAWRDQPVTQFVMAALTSNADECRDEWLRQSWEAGSADEMVLIGLRERADALLGFTADYDAFCETLNLEPGNE